MLPVHKGHIHFGLIGIGLLICSMITACNPSVENPTPVVSPTPPLATALPMEPSKQPDNEFQSITIWIPPRFAPDTPAGSLLSEHLSIFEDAYALININLRVKEENGP